MVIPPEKYAAIIEVLPILCVDVVIQNSADEYLLVRRLNEPRAREWWVVGGRVLKGEALAAAARRKAREEASLEISAVRPIGYYEAMRDVNPCGASTPYHAVSIVFWARVSDYANVRLDEQSADWHAARALPENFVIHAFSELASPTADGRS